MGGAGRKTRHTHETYKNLQTETIHNSDSNTPGTSVNSGGSLGIILKKRSKLDQHPPLLVKRKKTIRKTAAQSVEAKSPEAEVQAKVSCPVEALEVGTIEPTEKNAPKTNWLTELSSKRKLTIDPNLSSLGSAANIIKPNNVKDLDQNITITNTEASPLDHAIVRVEDYQIPVKTLHVFFEYIGHKYEVVNGFPKKESTSIQAKCLLCEKLYSYMAPSSGGVSTLLRHLKKNHPEKSQEVEKKRVEPEENSKAILHSWIHSKGKYQKADIQQKGFNQSLMYCISKDKLPMSLGTGEGFQHMIHTIDSKITIPSRSTIQRRFKKEHETAVIPNLRQTLNTVDKCIVSLDGWKSKRKDGILAFKCHFIDNNWRIRNLTLGIREINESQTGDAIRKYFNCITTELNIKEKVKLVMTDSGSNMVKAFKAPVGNVDAEDGSEGYTDEEEDDEMDILEDDIILYCGSDTDDEDSGDVDTESGIDESIDIYGALEPLLGDEIQHLRCSSHQLQLGINKALETKEASSFLAYVNKIINFFSNNTVYLARLRKLAGKGLLKRALTRWNFWVDAVKRLAEDKVYQVVDKLLQQAHRTMKRDAKKRLPQRLKNCDRRKMKEFCMILEPFADQTDKLQGDGVTSSLLINNLVHKLRATALDPRMKLNVFKLTDSGGLRLPSYIDAKAICDQYLFAKNTEASVPTPAKPAVTVTNFIDEINQEAQASSLPEIEVTETDFDRYLKEPVVASNSNVLKYWKSTETLYPSLAAAAKFVLSIPASSGSVERCFSELSAIGRSRRASTKAPTFEQLVLHSEHIEELVKLNRTDNTETF